MVNRDGIVYLRTVREPTPILYTENDQFPIGGSKTHLFPVIPGLTGDPSNIEDSRFRGNDMGGTDSNNKQVTIIATGITVIEALEAQKLLAEEGTQVRVIDCYSIKPIDAETIRLAARQSKAIITVEDHYPVGGLGDSVLEALAENEHPPVYKLAVYKTPRSGKAEELLAYEEIDAAAIIKKIKSLS